jgi:hypothetical protein
MNCGKQNLPCLMCASDSRMISIGKLRTKACIHLTHKFVKMTVGCEVYHTHIKYTKYTCIKNYYSLKYYKYFKYRIMVQIYTQRNLFGEELNTLEVMQSMQLISITKTIIVFIIATRFKLFESSSGEKI